MEAEIYAQRIYGGRWETFGRRQRNIVLKTITWCVDHLKELAEDDTTFVDAQTYLDALIPAVESVSGIEWESITGKRRFGEIVRWRQISANLLRYHTDLRVVEIARLFGKHHSTIIAEVNSCNARCKYDRSFNADLYKVMAEISSILNQ